MKQKDIKRNYIYNIINQILQLLVPLVTTPYISRVLGAEGIGKYSFANSIVTYFTLFATMGTTNYGQREISYVQDNREKRSIVLWETKVFSMITAFICSIVYCIFLSINQFSYIYIILYLNIVSVAFDITWFYQGIEEFDKIVKRNVILKILSVCFIFMFVKNKQDLILYVIGITVFSFLGTCSLWIGIRNYIDKPKWESLRPFRNITIILGLFIPNIAIEVYTVLDKTMLGVLTIGNIENGYYEQAIKMSRIPLTIITALTTVMVPRIGFLFEQGKKEQVREYVYLSYQFVWFLGIPLCFGMIGIASNVVPWFFGIGFEKVADLLIITSWLILAIGFGSVTGTQYLVPTKREKAFTFSVIVGAISNFILNLCLIPSLYSLGAAIASVIAEILVTTVQFIMVRKEISIKRVLYSGIHYYIAGGIMLILLIIERKYLSASFFNTVFMICSGTIVYVGILFLLKDEFLLDNIKKLFGKIISKN